MTVRRPLRAASSLTICGLHHTIRLFMAINMPTTIRVAAAPYFCLFHERGTAHCAAISTCRAKASDSPPLRLGRHPRRGSGDSLLKMISAAHACAAPKEVRDDPRQLIRARPSSRSDMAGLPRKGSDRVEGISRHAASRRLASSTVARAVTDRRRLCSTGRALPAAFQELDLLRRCRTGYHQFLR